MEDFVQVLASSERAWTVVRMRCPRCKERGVFETLGPSDTFIDVYPQGQAGVFAGARRCPNPDCHALVLFHRQDLMDAPLTAYPPERIDFDSTNLPAKVLASLTEAVTCHANACYRASAMMVRRTLEALCDDKEATGKDLKARLRVLRENVVLPEALLEGLDELRFLGNDAAHIEAKTYDDIGYEEAKLAIDVAKEVLKGVYQYSDLLARLKERQRSAEDGGEGD